MVKRNYTVYAHFINVIDNLNRAGYFSNLGQENSIRRFEDPNTYMAVEVLDPKENQWIGVTHVAIPKAKHLDRTNDQRATRQTLRGLRTVLGVMVE